MLRRISSFMRLWITGSLIMLCIIDPHIAAGSLLIMPIMFALWPEGAPC